jgi:hypothetical protein
MNNPLTHVLNYLKTIQKAVVYGAHYLKQIADRDQYLSSIEDQLCDLYTLLAEEQDPYINSDEYWATEALTCAIIYLPQLIEDYPGLDPKELSDMALDKGTQLANALKESFESKFPIKN